MPCPLPGDYLPSACDPGTGGHDGTVLSIDAIYITQGHIDLTDVLPRILEAECFLMSNVFSLSHRLFGWLVPRSVKSYQTKFSAKRDVNGTLFKLRGTDSKLCRRLCYISNSMKINYRCKENFEQKDERKRQFLRIFRYARPDSWDGM